jgi:hypothetical protein
MRALLLGLLIATGCVTDKTVDEPVKQPPTSDPQPRGAQQMFEEDVFPVLAASCGGCHTAVGGTLLGFPIADATTTYAQLVTTRDLVGDFTPETARILQLPHITSRLPLSTEIATITAWLALEHQERQ